MDQIQLGKIRDFRKFNAPLIPKIGLILQKIQKTYTLKIQNAVKGVFKKSLVQWQEN